MNANTSNLPLSHENFFWKIIPHLTSPLSAASAITFTFYGFKAKSALQTNLKFPAFKFKQNFTSGLKASPTIGCVIGTQVLSQNAIEHFLTSHSNNKNYSSLNTMTISSILTAFISTIPLAVLNGQSLNQPILTTIRSLSMKQTTAIVARETSFLFSLRISQPLTEAIKQKTNNNKFIEVASIFATGAIGSLAGHPADTALTRLQKGMPIQLFKQSLKGSATRAVTVGIFNVIYQKTKYFLDSKI